MHCNSLEALRMAASLDKQTLLRKFGQVQKEIQTLMLLVQWCCFLLLLCSCHHKKKKKRKRKPRYLEPTQSEEVTVCCSLQQQAASSSPWMGKLLLPCAAALILSVDSTSCQGSKRVKSLSCKNHTHVFWSCIKQNF